MPLWSVAALVLLINLPFGYWRGRCRRFSWPWFLSIHLPIPFVVVLRLTSGLGFRPATYPALVGAYFLGQYFGGRLGRRRGG
jgi:hypothetical protein